MSNLLNILFIIRVIKLHYACASPCDAEMPLGNIVILLRNVLFP